MNNDLIVNGYKCSQDQYAQILGNMIRENLITKNEGKKLNNKLKKIHGIDLLNLYKRNYGFIK